MKQTKINPIKLMLVMMLLAVLATFQLSPLAMYAASPTLVHIAIVSPASPMLVISSNPPSITPRETIKTDVGLLDGYYPTATYSGDSNNNPASDIGSVTISAAPQTDLALNKTVSDPTPNVFYILWHQYFPLTHFYKMLC